MAIRKSRDGPTSDGTVRPQVLVVDDDGPTRSVLVGLVRFLGYEADSAPGGKEAIEAVGRGDYGIILMDLVMPGMDGIEVTHRIRSLKGAAPRPRIIGLSGHGEQATRDRCLAAGMDDFLVKPVDQRVLEAALGRA